MQGIPGQRIACRLQQCERHKCFAQCYVAQRDVQWGEMHEDVAIAHMSEREHLSVAGRASASEGVSSPTGRSVGRCSTDAMLGDRISSSMDAVRDQSDRG